MSRLTEEQRLQEQVKADKLKREQAASDLRKVMSIAEGRRVMHRIIYGLARLEEVVDISSTETVIFRQGARAVGRQLLDECRTHTLKRTKQMIEEAFDG